MSVSWARDALPQVSSNLEKAIDDLKAEIGKIQVRAEDYQLYQPLEDIPLDIKDRPLHPENPRDTDWSIIYLHAFETGGYAALTRAVQTRAAEHVEDKTILSSGNYKIMDNDDNLRDFMMILASMLPHFIKSLIKGDVFERYSHDEVLHRAVSLAHTLDKLPGNYLQGLVQADSLYTTAATSASTSTQAASRIENVHKGRGLTLKQLFTVWKTAERYLPSSPQKDLKIVKEIDNIFPPPPPKPDYAGGIHKYVQKSRVGKPGNEAKFLAWMKVMEKTYINRIREILKNDDKDPILDIPMRVSLLEVGWGRDVKERAGAHDNHISSNALFTFFQAVVKYEFGDQADQAQFEVGRLATNFLNHGGTIDKAFNDAKIADTGVTMVAQSEYFNPGLNPAPGGGAGVGKAPLEKRLPWIVQHAEKTYTDRNSRFKLNVVQDVEKLERFKKVDEMTDLDFARLDAAFERAQKDFQRKCDRLANEMKLLEDVKLMHISDKLGRSGGLAMGQRSRAQNDAGLSASPRGFMRGYSDDGDDLEEEDDDIQETDDELEAIAPDVSAGGDEEEEDWMRPPEGSSP